MTTITTIAALDAAIAAANADAANTGIVTIDLGGTIALGATALTQINLNTGNTLDIVGGGAVLDGGGTERGLFVYAGVVNVGNLTLANMVAQGGAGGAVGGGGGAGLGGGLFVGANVAGDAGRVTLTNVSFTGDQAIGGNGAGGSVTKIIAAYNGGGGGLGGAGTAGDAPGAGFGGDGGGVGGGAGGVGAGSGGLIGPQNGGPGGVGGFGGGGGGGGIGVRNGNGGGAGSGGFGGGGGAGGYGYGFAGGGSGGSGGFGGGGGGGGGSFLEGAGGSPGRGGFGGGGGSGSILDIRYSSTGAGGGGLGAGGDIFVQGGASVTIAGTVSLAAGTVRGGTSGGAAYVTGNPSPASQGFGLGNGIFLQGNQTLTLDPGAAFGAKIISVIADQTGSKSILSHGVFTAGAGALLLEAGTVTLSAANTYTGATTIDAGATLALAGSGSIAGSAAVIDNGRFSFTAAGASIRSLAGTNAAAGVALGSLQLTLTAPSGSFAGIISGTGGLTVSGTGDIETLTGANTYTGVTTISAGATLALVGALPGALMGALTGDNIAATASVADAGVLLLSGATVGKIISGAGALTAASGISTLSAAETYTGATTISAGATLSLVAAGALPASSNVADNGVLALNGQTLTKTIDGTGMVAAASGVSTLAVPEFYAGGTSIGAATLVLANSKGAGPGAIGFAAGSTGILQIDLGDAPANMIAGLLPGATIELVGVGTETTHTLTAGNVLTLSGGTTPVTLHLATAQSFSAYSFILTADATTGGTDLQVVPDPVITNVAPGTVEHGHTTELATIVPARAGDALTLTQTAGSGTLSLQPITGGDALIYTAPAIIPTSKLDAVSYEILENGGTATGSGSVQLDSGPKAGSVHLTIAPGLNVDLTALLLARATAGLPADSLTLSADSTAGTTGTVALLAGDLSYTAPATGTADSFGYTVSDQLGGGVLGTVPVTINSGLATSANVALTGAGNVVIGGNGTDIISGGTGGNLVSLGRGTDTVTITGAGDTILLGGGSDTVTGTQGMAFIVTTGAGHDMITVGGSHNRIDAVAGTNAITGGTGDDIFGLPAAGVGLDTITGFTESNGDVLDLRGAMAATGWNGTMATLGHYLHIADSGDGTVLSIVPGGSGSPVQIAQLTGVSYGLADLTSHVLL